MGKGNTTTVKDAMEAKGSPPIDPLEIYKKIDDFDTDYMDAGTIVSDFLSFCVTSLRHYRENDKTQTECEGNQEDLLHEIELRPLKSAFNGYKMYRQLKEIREERRRCKNENEMLFHLVKMLEKHPEFLSELSFIKDRCEETTKHMNERRYKTRGNILQKLGLVSGDSF